MGEVLLWSFQPAARLGELHTTGQLVGSWERVPPSPGDACLRAYRAMVAAMERAGIPTHGRPPVWAWGGSCGVTVHDAHMLLGDAARDHVTIEFTAPAELVLASDYGAWNDHLAERVGGGPADARWDVPTPIGDELVQACLPALRLERVRAIRPLPASADQVTHPAARA
ncbi:MAG TPA: hypothetical protein VKZ81_22760 [Pseudonocardia sp.]|uniref:hypothetical protein n=1 Tax=Pseudonocardia sp. TaxID=60912 RepID=UPI002B4B1D04|nr:hypothetical protein [Pseudonocardia sp.]HLU58291.1 hypothetical protein [Pseudonocardia sp.]